MIETKRHSAKKCDISGKFHKQTHAEIVWTSPFLTGVALFAHAQFTPGLSNMIHQY